MGEPVPKDRCEVLVSVLVLVLQEEVVEQQVVLARPEVEELLPGWEEVLQLLLLLQLLFSVTSCILYWLKQVFFFSKEQPVFFEPFVFFPTGDTGVDVTSILKLGSPSSPNNEPVLTIHSGYFLIGLTFC